MLIELLIRIKIEFSFGQLITHLLKTVPSDSCKNFESGTSGSSLFVLCEISWMTPLFAVMEAARHRLAPLNQQVGAPWPHQQRQFLQEAIQILEETQVKRLDAEHYPSCEQFTNDCCADASAFLEMVEAWSCDWRVAFGAVHLAFAGLYAHPELGSVKVAGVPVRGVVRKIFDFFSERGIAFGKLDAAVSGVYKCWDETEHPAKALLRARLSINQLCRTILKSFFEEPECAHSLLQGRIVHFYDDSN
jgi:hypothetical protein